ncbi:MAG TPA: hypothetical protein VJ878_01365, partial [Candidatus Izemoplasmatales bacterium]|nr:hypothetical protein [Candidatus Izemoplasmatales bacterium]
SASVADQQIDYVFYESDDGITYTETTSLTYTMRQPGDIKYYRVEVTNPDTSDYNVNVYLSGLADVNSDGTPYVGPASLTEVVALSASVDGSLTVDDTLDQLVAGSIVSVSNAFVLLGGQTKTVDFSLTILGTADNTYQNLGIEVDEIKIYFDTQ